MQSLITEFSYNHLNYYNESFGSFLTAPITASNKPNVSHAIPAIKIAAYDSGKERKAIPAKINAIPNRRIFNILTYLNLI